MKKIISAHFKPFWQIAVRVFKTRWYVVFAFTLLSCSVQNQINKDDFHAIPKNFSASFYDVLDTLDNQYNNKIYTRSLMKGFTKGNNIDYANPIKIKIEDKELLLQFEDANKKQHVLKFFGQRQKKRFVFYTNYQTVSFPILFIQKEMTKYSVYLSDTNEIIFEEHQVNEGMFLLFGAGNSSKSDYKFKLLKNE